MQHTKKWLAAMLAAAIAISDCGSMTVLATEDISAAEDSISENDIVISDESVPKEESEKDNDSDDISSPISEDTDNIVTNPEADPAAELPALHIGQIKKGEDLPDFYDTEFVYDLPVSFEMSDQIVLFANYNLNTILEEDGALVWSILRGDKGMTTGSTSLVDEEDDWTDFETVSDSPLFVMEEITDEESEYYQMMALTLAEPSSAAHNGESSETVEAYEKYDYYIRAAYYTEAENAEAESFYAAATIPFVPRNTDTEEIQEDAANTDEISADDMQNESSVSENNSEPSVSDPAEDSVLSTDENDDESVLPEQTSEDISTLSENNSTEQVSALAESDELPPLEEESDIELILYQVTEIGWTNVLDEKDEIMMAPGDTQQITATTEPEMTQADISWESSDETVATVTAGENGTVTITAFAEGYAKITATCQGVTASFIVDVVLDTANFGNDKLLDLSGGIRVAGFEKESDDLVYNGQKITQNLRVYHNNTLLKEKTDYTLSYKNNINAAEWNSVKAPSVTINLKGQYQGSVTLFYTIKPLDINNIDSNNTDGTSPGYEQTVNYSKKLNIPAPVLTFNKKKLAVNKDFICDYTTPEKGMTPLPTDIKDGDLYNAGTVYSYTVKGTGNFTSSFPMQLVVLNDKNLNFSSASVKLDKKQYEYHGAPLTESDVLIDEVKLGGNVLNKTDYDYKVYATGITGAYVMLSPSVSGRNAGYRGSKKITLKLVGDRQLNPNVTVPGEDWKESIPFSQKTVDKDGGIFQTGSALLTYKDGAIEEPLSAGTDYTIKYSNAKKAGKVTVTFTGKGRYKGSLRLTYTITPNTDIKIFPGKNVINKNGNYEIAYQKDGAIPELILKDQDYTVLKNKTDYTIKYKDNVTPGTPMTCEITGKGNYKGYEKTVILTVTKADINQCTISVTDKPFSPQSNKWQSTVTIKDVNGKKLTAGKDYDKTLIFDYNQEQSPPAGTTITVTVNGLGCYEDSSISGTYRIFAKNISTLKVVIDPQEYTGEEITLLPIKDIHIYANNTDAKKKQNEIREDYYEIVGYTNNIKAGTAKVTLRGKGDYGGTKTYSFKIQKKEYKINHVKGIQLDKTSLSFPLAENDTAKRTLTATITSGSREPIANSTVIWSSSNSSIVDIEEPPTTAETYIDGKAAVTSKVILTLKKEGSVTITAIAQDGNKKAQCKVSVIDAPLLLEAGETIREEIGNTYQLHMEFTGSQDPNKVSWESSNADAISVNKDGLLKMEKASAVIIKAVYKSGNRSYTQECYAVAIDPNEEIPEGKVLTYEQKAGTTDDTSAINNLLYIWEKDQSKYDCMYIPAGVYHIDAVKDSIILRDNQTLIMSPSALLIAIPNNQDNSHVIVAYGRNNVTISGGQIIGERKEHKGSNGEHGHGIQISGCTNVYISDVEVSQCWGDGIYLGRYDGWDENGKRKTYYGSDIKIENCNLHHNRRSNLSITDVSNVTVRRCQFNYANGTDPQYGIDIEPNSNYTCKNVTISDSTFHKNAKGTIQILGQLNANVNGVTIENCKGDKKPLVAWGYGGGGTVSGVTEKNNNWNWNP